MQKFSKKIVSFWFIIYNISMLLIFLIFELLFILNGQLMSKGGLDMEKENCRHVNKITETKILLVTTMDRISIGRNFPLHELWLG